MTNQVHSPSDRESMLLEGTGEPIQPDRLSDDDAPASTASPANTLAGRAATVIESTWRYPGFEPDAEALEDGAAQRDGAGQGEESAAGSVDAATSPADVIAGAAETRVASVWSYPGCNFAPAVETPADAPSEETQPRGGWPYGTLSSAPVTKKVIRTVRVKVWCYPGVVVDDGVWADQLIEVEEEAPVEESAEASLEVSTAQSPTSIRVGKRRKSKEVNPIFLMIGIVSGGVIGLALGYLILLLIGGRELDFLGLFY